MQHETHRIVRQLTQTLRQMDTWIPKVQAHAAAKKYDPNLLLQYRLAPDMFPLVRQLGSACDNAKLLAARTSGKTAPVHADDQKTWDEVHQRIGEVVAWIGDLTEADFANAAATKATFPWFPGKYLEADPYVYQYAIPNFHFHATMAYAILRHNGVELGKFDFLGPIPYRETT